MTCQGSASLITNLQYPYKDIKLSCLLQPKFRSSGILSTLSDSGSQVAIRVVDIVLRQHSGKQYVLFHVMQFRRHILQIFLM
jgi:hypothetical protein